MKMNIYVALFRGINVGGKNILPMNELVLLMEEAGCHGIKTYIQSGNAVFRAKPNERGKIKIEIGDRILKKYNFRPGIFVLEAEDFKKSISKSPFIPEDDKNIHFYFLESTPPNPDIKNLNKIKKDSEEFYLLNDVLYLHAPEGIGRSKLAARVEKAMGIPATARNGRSVKKIMEILESLARL
ncbi:MAG: DUF1697 domain-containing protein [Spirochaetales bacterium]|nr:DUF1697 domain-containing protein [Spirochaetales bacterium]